MDAAWSLIAVLGVFVMYGALVVHRARLTSLRSIRSVKAALLDGQSQLALTLLDDLESMFCD